MKSNKTKITKKVSKQSVLFRIASNAGISFSEAQAALKAFSAATESDDERIARERYGARRNKSDRKRNRDHRWL